MDTNGILLKAILATVARQTFPPTELVKLITANTGGAKQIMAYNLCDGGTAQSEICKQTKIDPASLSRSIARWIEIGILIRIGDEQNPLHLYPVPKEYIKSKPKK